MKSFKLYSILILLSVLLAACAEQNSPYKETVLSGSTMGTSYTVKFINDERVFALTDVERVKQSIQAQLDKIDQMMSTYRADSVLSKFNHSEIGQWYSLPPELMAVLKESQALSQLSNGLFDITIGPLVTLWGFGPKVSNGVDRVPGKHQISLALNSVGFAHLALDIEASQAKRLQNIELDLSAIAKGYGVDKVADVLSGHGIDNFLVEVGGEIKSAGFNRHGKAWVLGVERPDTIERSAMATINLTDRSLATSGDYRNYFEQDGVRYSHTIDPRTGYPITHNLASVSVIDASCARADGLATMLYVMGEELGYVFASEHNIAAYFIYRDEDLFKIKYTQAFSGFLSEG